MRPVLKEKAEVAARLRAEGPSSPLNLREVSEDPVEREVDAARDDLGLDALFGSPENAGMTQREFEQYESVISDARQAAQSQLIRDIKAREKRARVQREKNRKAFNQFMEELQGWMRFQKMCTAVS